MSEKLIPKSLRLPESICERIAAARERATAAAGLEVKEAQVIAKALDLGLAEMEKQAKRRR